MVFKNNLHTGGLTRLQTNHLEKNKTAEGVFLTICTWGRFPKETVAAEHKFGKEVNEMQMNRRGCLSICRKQICLFGHRYILALYILKNVALLALILFSAAYVLNKYLLLDELMMSSQSRTRTEVETAGCAFTYKSSHVRQFCFGENPS